MSILRVENVYSLLLLPKREFIQRMRSIAMVTTFAGRFEAYIIWHICCCILDVPFKGTFASIPIYCTRHAFNFTSPRLTSQ